VHRESLDTMGRLLDEYAADARTVLDVGAYDVNGTYRGLCVGSGYSYTGADQQAGPNVDRVMDGTWDDVQYDIVISGQTLEHCENPFELMETICSHAKQLVIVIAPWFQPLHRYPVDCWRIMPDGMEKLIEYAGWSVAEVGMDHRDTYGVATPKG
jgi:hypothetical protein